MSSTLSPERWLLLTCLKGLIDEESLGIDRLTAMNLNWDKAYYDAHSHGILGFVVAYLKKHNLTGCIPRKAQTYGTLHILHCERKNRTQVRNFEHLRMGFLKQGIHILPLKGVAMSYLIYERMPYRLMADIDILIQEEDLESAIHLLAKMGFNRTLPITTKNRWHDRIYVLNGLPVSYIPLGRADYTDGKSFVDLHWSPSYKHRGGRYELDLENMQKRAIQIDSSTHKLRMFSPSDQMFYTLVHALDAYPVKLYSLLDVALLARTFGVNIDLWAGRYKKELPVALWNSVNIFLRGVHFLTDMKRYESDHHFRDDEFCDMFFSKKTIRYPWKNSISDTFNMLRSIKSFWKRCLFILGYFFPNPKYYTVYGRFSRYAVHWREIFFNLRNLVAHTAKYMFHHLSKRSPG